MRLTSDDAVCSVTQRAQRVLLLWQIDLISSQEVSDWVIARLMESANPGSLPNWIFTLVESGPDRCAKMSSADFDFPWIYPDVPTRIVAKMRCLDTADSTAVERFVLWLVRECHGEDTSDPFVQIGLELESRLWDDESLDRVVTDASVALSRLRPEIEARVAALYRDAGILSHES
jgi:hypothetical protein